MRQKEKVKKKKEIEKERKESEGQENKGRGAEEVVFWFSQNIRKLNHQKGFQVGDYFCVLSCDETEE